MAKPPRKQMSGGAKLMASGKKPVLLGLSPAQFHLISKAATLLDLRKTEFITDVAVSCSRRIIELAAAEATSPEAATESQGVEVASSSTKTAVEVLEDSFREMQRISREIDAGERKDGRHE